MIFSFLSNTIKRCVLLQGSMFVLPRVVRGCQSAESLPQIFKRGEPEHRGEWRKKDFCDTRLGTEFAKWNLL